MEKSEYTQLATVKVGGKCIRFICYRSSHEVYVASLEEVLQHCDQPLFLACDVLAGTAQAAKNYPRIHAKYATNGLATKLTCHDMKIEGINNSKSLWFYSVQGLFKVAFEYLDCSAQWDCLTHLKDLWIQEYSKNRLDETIIVSRQQQLDIPQVCRTTGTQLGHNAEDMRTENMRTAQSHQIHKFCPVTDNTTRVCAPDEELNAPPNQIVNNMVGGHQSDITSLSTLLDEIYYVIRLKKQHLYESEQHSIDKLIVMLDFCKHEFINHPTNENDGFPFLILQKYLDLLKGGNNVCDTYANSFSIPYKLNIAMCIICEWLGDQFLALSDAIFKNVGIFKEQHLDCIDNLPPPHVIICDLFPRCMQILLKHWLKTDKQIASKNYATCTSIASKRHCGDDSSGVLECRDNDALIQFILEFTSGALISGVAHVVYSRLVNM